MFMMVHVLKLSLICGTKPDTVFYSFESENLVWLLSHYQNKKHKFE